MSVSLQNCDFCKKKLDGRFVVQKCVQCPRQTCKSCVNLKGFDENNLYLCKCCQPGKVMGPHDNEQPHVEEVKHPTDDNQNILKAISALKSHLNARLD